MEISKDMTFEEALENLQHIVTSLEKGDVSLDESMKLYEDGTMYASYCNKKLKEARQKITEIEKEN